MIDITEDQAMQRVYRLLYSQKGLRHGPMRDYLPKKLKLGVRVKATPIVPVRMLVYDWEAAIVDAPHDVVPAVRRNVARNALGVACPTARDTGYGPAFGEQCQAGSEPHMGAPVIETHARVADEQPGRGAAACADGSRVGVEAPLVRRIGQEHIGHGACAFVDRTRHIDGHGRQRLQQVKHDRLSAQPRRVGEVITVEVADQVGQQSVDADWLQLDQSRPHRSGSR
nr:hypothetical protein [Glycomyces tenuis]